MSSTSKYRSTPTFSFKSRNKIITSYNDISKLPAPNSYNPHRKDQKNQPAVIFPKSSRGQHFIKRFSTPGPGNYQTKSHITEGPKKTLAKKLIQKIDLNPSPSQYDPNHSSIQKQMPRYTIPAKQSSNEIELTFKNNLYKPSPGDYQTAKNTGFPMDKMRSIEFPKSARPSQILNKLSQVGPGAYLQQDTWKKQSFYKKSSCSISKAARTLDLVEPKGEASPGPGNYQNSSLFQQNKQRKRGYSCRIKTQSKTQQMNPGPGQYQSPILKYKYKSTSNIKIGQNRRSNFTQRSKQMQSHPGPGSYQPNPQTVKFKSQNKCFKFNKQKLDRSVPSKSNQDLAPGSYNIEYKSLAKQKSTPSFSFNKTIYKIKEFQSNKSTNSPGPGNYDPKLINNRSIQFRMPKQLRPLDKKPIYQSKIGPGSYEKYANQITPKRSFKFSKSPRCTFTDQICKRTNQAESYSSRQEFPNPPKYMNVHSKLKINAAKLTKQ